LPEIQADCFSDEIGFGGVAADACLQAMRFQARERPQRQQDVALLLLCAPKLCSLYAVELLELEALLGAIGGDGS